ncbi:ABC transporter substrate-binding protein [Fontivita pretiosa]|uniref:ABC transporter substrate-binding protein n=1 Tax=Fontivita pretiosa TaxID=2989684 RepID=UPI003D17F27F
MSFHLGKPILVMLLVALVSGAVIALRDTPPQKDLTLWVFAEGHAITYRSIIGQFERETGKSVEIHHLSTRAENVRLESMFMTGQTGRALPDVVEIEISHVGKFFRPPISQVGFLPLNDYLQRGGWDRKLVAARFAPWSKQDVIFGVPHDVHPVSLTYRDDLFRQAGIDLAQAQTWPQLHDLCLKFQEYWRARGYATRHAIELPRASADYVIVMLLQRGVNLVDQYDRIHINNPKVAQTVAFYAQVVAGPRKIAAEAAGGTGVWTNDALAGNLCAFITPDWRIFHFRRFTPQLEGKLRMRPLPRFDPTDAPTSTWGGTMIGITRDSRNHDDAWKLIKFLYLSDTGMDALEQTFGILPPVVQRWDEPFYHQPDPFFGGQKILELYADLARQIPPRYVTPVTAIAQAELSVVVSRAVRYLEDHGPQGLEAQCQKWLDTAAEDIRRRIEHGRFDE